jgi:hypothetical protein
MPYLPFPKFSASNGRSDISRDIKRIEALLFIHPEGLTYLQLLGAFELFCEWRVRHQLTSTQLELDQSDKIENSRHEVIRAAADILCRDEGNLTESRTGRITHMLHPEMKPGALALKEATLIKTLLRRMQASRRSL